MTRLRYNNDQIFVTVSGAFHGRYNSCVSPYCAPTGWVSMLATCRSYSSSTTFMNKSFSSPTSAREGEQEVRDERLKMLHLPAPYELQEKAFKSRRRFSADNTRGRSEEIKQVLCTLKAFQSREGRQAFFSRLHPRQKLDVLNALYNKSKSKKKQLSGLPKYFSVNYGRSFFFREEDLKETSTLGRGPGGQATNRRKQTVILVHVPTQLSVKVSRFPSLHLNRRAAREMMNLRLEERLAGDKSLLGKAKLDAARHAAHALRQRERRSWKKAVQSWKRSHSTSCYGFLKGDEPLPPYVQIAAGLSFSTNHNEIGFSTPNNRKGIPVREVMSSPSRLSLRITDFLNMKSSALWSLVYQACQKDNPGVSILEGCSQSLVPVRPLTRKRGTTLSTNTSACFCTEAAESRAEFGTSTCISKSHKPEIFPLGTASTVSPGTSPTAKVASLEVDYKTPSLLYFFFPVAGENTASIPQGGKELKQYGKGREDLPEMQVQRCRNDSSVLQRVKALLEVFCELFGLRLEESFTSDFSAANISLYRQVKELEAPKECNHRKRLSLVKDGQNWEEMRNRLFTNDGLLTHVAFIIWGHLLKCTRDIGFLEERIAVRKFFHRHNRQMLELSAAQKTLKK